MVAGCRGRGEQEASGKVSGVEIEGQTGVVGALGDELGRGKPHALGRGSLYIGAPKRPGASRSTTSDTSRPFLFRKDFVRCGHS